MKQCMIFGFVKVNSLLITGCQFEHHPLFEKLTYLPQRTQLVAPPISVKNHYQYAMPSTGSPEVRCLCFVLI